MVKYLINILWMSTCMVASLSHAENLRDPTMPPASLNQTNTDLANAIPVGPVLQSVMIGSQQKAAVISGQYVKVGKKYEQYVLVSVTQTEVVLRAPDGSKQVLKIEFPIQKKPAAKVVTIVQKVRMQAAMQREQSHNNKRESL